MEITIKLETAGDFTHNELEDYIRHCLGIGIISYENPFISDDSNAEIIDVDFY